MQDKPSHYFVIRSPYAQLILTGVKTFEWRTNATMFANKRLAVAVSKSRAHEDDLQDDIARWEKRWNKFLKKVTAEDHEDALTKLKRNRVKAEKLFKKTNGCGMIIGEILTGDVATYDGFLGVSVQKFKLWPESDWIESPGGLGVRHMPGGKWKYLKKT
jgi:hypothetical protein